MQRDRAPFSSAALADWTSSDIPLDDPLIKQGFPPLKRALESLTVGSMQIADARALLRPQEARRQIGTLFNTNSRQPPYGMNFPLKWLQNISYLPVSLLLDPNVAVILTNTAVLGPGQSEGTAHEWRAPRHLQSPGRRNHRPNRQDTGRSEPPDPQIARGGEVADAPALIRCHVYAMGPSLRLGTQQTHHGELLAPCHERSALGHVPSKCTRLKTAAQVPGYGDCRRARGVLWGGTDVRWRSWVQKR